MSSRSTRRYVSPSGSRQMYEDHLESLEGTDATTRTNNVRRKDSGNLPPPKPSSDFIKRRHERMRDRMTRPVPKEEELVHILSVDTEETKNKKPAGAITTASPTAIRSFRQLRAKRKTRVPGGAAAKLIGKTNEDETPPSTESADSGDEPVAIVPPTDEFIKIRDEAKAAFTVGTKENRRYHSPSKPMQASNEDSRHSGRYARSITGSEGASGHNRSEFFHENATVAVLSLLSRPDTPLVHNSSSHMRHQDGIPAVTSSRSRDHPPPKDFTQTPAMQVTPRNAFQAPHRRTEDVHPPIIGIGSNVAVKQPFLSGAVPSEDLEATIKGKNPLEQPLLSKKAEQRVAQIKEQMQDPNQTLSDLISTIATPDDHQPDDTFTRGYMVRRKNACGALQVLTAKNVHRVQICWTAGILPALGSVLEDSGNRELSSVIPDANTRREFMEARKRAVSALMNLSMPPENRLAVFHTPRMVSNIVRVINLDEDEARKGCCAILAHLAKTKENRLLMVQVHGLIDAVTEVIKPKPLEDATPKFSEDEHDDDDDSSRTPDHEFPLRSMSTSAASAGAPEMMDSYLSGDESKLESQQTETDIMTSTLSEDLTTTARRYDDDPNEHLHGARVNVFALLTHLVKEKDNAYILARHKFLVETLVGISALHDSPTHEHAVKLLAHLTRHRGNSKYLVFKVRTVVPALVKASFSQNDEARKYSMFALQNLSQDKPCRQELAITNELLTALCVRIRQASDIEERLAAIHAMKNLTDEPADLIPMTNTPECFATLMQIAHGADDSVTEMMQYLGCDALATLSHWFRSIATSGQRIELMKNGGKPNTNNAGLFVPSLKLVTYEQWQ